MQGEEVEPSTYYTDYTGLQPLYTAGLTAITDSNIQAAVDEWVAQPAIAAAKYGDIGWWDVGGVTDMSSLFSGKGSFEEDLSHW